MDRAQIERWYAAAVVSPPALVDETDGEGQTAWDWNAELEEIQRRRSITYPEWIFCETDINMGESSSNVPGAVQKCWLLAVFKGVGLSWAEVEICRKTKGEQGM